MSQQNLPLVETVLSASESYARECTDCNLHHTRTRSVFGEGNFQADLMIIGEAPGHNEDQTGRPFCGRSGKLLDNMLKAMNLTRQEVYITNTVKCRPPDNRDPTPEERSACRHLLSTQIRAIAPKVILLTGLIATKVFFQNNDLKMKDVRGQKFSLHNIYSEEVPYIKDLTLPNTKVIPIYHPAAMLRNPKLKIPTWGDLQLVMEELNAEA